MTRSAANLSDLGAGMQMHVGLLQGKAQDVHHASGLVRPGVDPTGVICHSQKPQMLEEGQGFFQTKVL